MNYYGAKELADAFRLVRKNTITIADEIPADKYTFRVVPETRSVGELLAHVALAYRVQYQIQAEERRTTLEGFDFFGLIQRLIAEEKVPRSKEETIAMLRKSADIWGGWLEGLSESFLGERVHFGGPNPGSKSRFEMIMSVKEHEMHHRGQLMVIERMVGVVPHLTREALARRATAAARP